MNRRKALGHLGAVSAVASPFLAAETPAKRQYYELRYYQLRNGVSKRTLPSKPAGPGPIGVFNPVIGENSPYVLVLMPHASFADAEHSPELDFDYVRYEKTLLRAFTGMPELKNPPESKNGHIFELRTYESNNAATLQKKIEMFNAGEMAIFQRLGMNPVFFGEALVGTKLPHLTYMLAYDDLAARDRLWKDFGADPAWQKLRATPGLSDADIVSNIGNTILRPAAISDIR
jgi:hypothetical protein